MSLTEKALLVTFFQMIFVILLTAVTCYALVGTYLVGLVIASIIQVLLFPYSMKNWETTLKPKV